MNICIFFLAVGCKEIPVQFAIFQHTPWSSLFIIHNGTLMLLFLPVILFLKYMFVKSPKFFLPLKKDYINLRSLEGSVLMYSRWRWGWGKVLWSMTFLHRSNLGRWCSWDLKLSNLSTSGSGKVSCQSQRVRCMGENICAPAQLGWYKESAEIPATAVSPPLSLHSGITPFPAVFLCVLRHLSALLVRGAGRVHVTTEDWRYPWF